MPEWMANLDDEDLTFIKKFILASGSLKEIAKQYGRLGNTDFSRRFVCFPYMQHTYCNLSGDIFFSQGKNKG